MYQGPSDFGVLTVSDSVNFVDLINEYKDCEHCVVLNSKLVNLSLYLSRSSII